MSNVYFCSDTHFGHKNIHNFRKQFSDSFEHDDFVCNSILSVVKKRDTLWILGDVCFDLSAFNYVKLIASKVNQLIIVPGNHDFEKSVSPKVEDYLSMPNVKIKPMTVYKGFWVTHAPIHPSELRGKRNIHGHTHFDNIKDNDYYNVSMENIDYKPILFQELVSNVNNFKRLDERFKANFKVKIDSIYFDAIDFSVNGLSFKYNHHIFNVGDIVNVLLCFGEEEFSKKCEIISIKTSFEHGYRYGCKFV